MLLPLLWLLQTTQPPARPAASPTRPSAVRRAPAVAFPGTLLVGSGGTERAVLLLEERDGGSARTYVRADQLASASGGGLAEDAPGRWRLRLPGHQLTLREGVPFVVVGAAEDTTELPLATAPMVEGERLWVPLQLLTDGLPGLAPEITFDAARRAVTFGRRRASAPRTVATAPVPTSPPPEPEVIAESETAPRDSSVRLPTIIGPRRTSPAAVDAEDVASPPPGGLSLARRMVVVDAGHGGPDGGMQGPLGGGPRIREKDVTLAVALALRNSLRTRGVGVSMTRTADTLIALADRGKIANQRAGDLFISIHVNAANPSWRDPASTRGFETYFLSEAKTADDRRVADLENESVRFEGASTGDRDDPLSFIMRDMAQNEHLRESSELAAIVQRRLARSHPGPSRGVRQAGFRVLVTAFMPAVLVEIGFGSNPADAAWMSSAQGQREIADAVADAAVDYLRRYEQRQRGGAKR
ncbi:MAG: N-acetylmuramoyl-L-alanine amidase family protein [Gemmatirosa sp.]